MSRSVFVHETAEAEINEAADFYDIEIQCSLLHSVESDEIRVLAVAHQKRRPFYWRGRR